VQRVLDGKARRYSDQAGDDWAGGTVAEVLGLDTTADRKRIKKMIEAWLKSGALKKVKIPDAKRMERSCLEVGEWANQ
jgi:hypothetical protein